MKNFFIFVGLAAAGSASLQACAQELTSMQSTKIWSVSSTLRGFYDDNFTTSPNGDKQGSAGYEVSPSVQFNVPLQQTDIGLKYTYGLYYYQERRNQGNDPYDQSHQVDLWLDHAFTERVQGTVKDTFAVGQEPTLLNPGGGPVVQPYRINGNNLANNANISLSSDWTREFSTVTTYNNSIYDFQNDNGTATDPSLAGQLNRLDQFIGTDFRWMVQPETIALIGYRFQWVLFTAGEPIAPGNPSHPATFYSDVNNNSSHFVYLGFHHSFLPNLNLAAQAGVQDTTYYNNSATPDFITPYVNITSSYTYAPGSYVQLGFMHEQSASANTSTGSNGNITQGQQNSVFSASVNHRLTAKLLGSLVGTIQDSRYNQGAFNNNSEVTYSFGANLTYAFNQHFSTELGYNFDDLESNVPQNGYSRNRVYLGVTAAY